MTDSTSLAQQEKKAARYMTLGWQRFMLSAAVVIWVAYLNLPHAGDVSGFDVTFVTASAREAGIKVTEYVYAVLSALGIGVCTTLVLITRRAVFGLVGWMLTTVGLACSIFALWLRQTSDGVDTSIGMYLSIVGVALAVIAYSMIALRRDPEQRRIAVARAASDNLDEVGRAQTALLIKERDRAEANPLLIDDRRQRAAERHREG